MRGLSWIGWVVAVGCYAPQPPTGGPCGADTDCPLPLTCAAATSTCERVGTDAPVPPTDGTTDGPVDAAVDAILIDGCSPAPEICGDGIDQSCDGVDPACAANDGAGGAIDVTAGGTFTANALLARDDVGPNGCGSAGGRDLYYRVSLPSPQVYYFDTFGSGFDTVVRVYARACGSVGSGAGAASCQNDACGGPQSQVAVSLPAGESCIVVDQASGGEPGGQLTLHVVPGGRDGRPLPAGVQTLTGDTCASTNITDPSSQNCDGPGTGGKDDALFFTTCPGQAMLLDADLCPEPAWDPVLYVKRVSGTQLGCNDDSCGYGARLTDVAITNSPLYFLYVDGFDAGECGPYSLDTNLR